MRINSNEEGSREKQHKNHSAEKNVALLRKEFVDEVPVLDLYNRDGLLKSGLSDHFLNPGWPLSPPKPRPLRGAS